ncbi:PadR family transcriptional regulator [Nocardioides hwasunensis]|uniref:Helix-turn-helix transcriptional regulator n=1 Tax=Nocardioides hwasunensis TaxID=397258 RepID=A0ABR8MDH6_9ACTN|nr:PadR family transcriptional regulator [Nocardioides hwasunensis]MBD3913146.1 helix-turn-helix transcriptional regulator [Nocardioides hwasunensis]
MSQDIPVTGYAILGLLTFGDELTGYEVKQRADITLRFYWVAPAMSQIYTELRRLTDHELVAARARHDGGREVTTYAITDAGQAALRAWMDHTPAGFPVLKHTVLLRLLIGHVTAPDETRRMLHEYVDELARAREDLTGVREMLRGADEPGEPFRFPSLVADWGLDYFAAETRHAQRALESLATHGPGDGDGETSGEGTDSPA